jgi:hypothetical protein
LSKRGKDVAKTNYAAVIADMEAERAKLDAAIAAMRSLAGLSAPSAAQGELGLGHAPGRPYEGMSLVKAAEAYLLTVGKPQKARKIADALKRGGFQSNAKRFNDMTYNQLDRAAKTGTVIEKNGSSFGLVEWNRKNALRPVS